MAHPSVTKRVIKRCTRIPHVAPPKELDDLTERELDVFRLIARGPSNAEIGQELHQRHDHITHILQKLDLRDRVQAIVLVYQTRAAKSSRGLVSLSVPAPLFRGRPFGV